MTHCDGIPLAFLRFRDCANCGQAASLHGVHGHCPEKPRARVVRWFRTLWGAL